MYDAGLRPGRVHVKLTILGLNNFDRNLEFEHNSASGSHPVPFQASSGCPESTRSNLVFPAALVIACLKERVIKALAAMRSERQSVATD